VIRLRQLFDPYIALMLATVALAALLPAEGRGAVAAGFAADAGIIFLFFLYGTRLSLAQARDGFRLWKLQGMVLASTFLLFPILGIALSVVAPTSLPNALITGLIFLCVLPSTVQSSIAFTSIARGNVAAALCAASASNIIGIFLSPILAGLLLHTHGTKVSSDEFRDIIMQLLLPFLAGQLLRPWIGAAIQRHKQILGYADRGSILLIIYVAFSKGVSDHIWRQIGIADLLTLFLLLAVLLSAALLLTGWIARRIMRFEVADEIVLQFCGSKKSLASGLPMGSVLFPGPQLGLIVLPLMLFHQLQLIVCAILARRYAMRPEKAVDPAGSGGEESSSVPGFTRT
jgi:solute carrier family 10 (sodium/bile acid cotransporter), member 7